MKQIEFLLNGQPQLTSFDTLVLPVFDQGTTSSLGQSLGADNLIQQLNEQGDFKGKPGQTLMLMQPAGLDCQRLLLVGFGKQDKLNDKTAISAYQAAAKAINASAAEQVLNGLTDAFPAKNHQAWCLYQLTLAAQKNQYDYAHPSRGKHETKPNKISQMTFSAADNAENQQAIQQAQATANGMELTQDLANMPSNFCTPTYLAETAQQLGQDYGFDISILDRDEMTKMGMGSFMSVAQGGEQPPKLICLSYKGAGDDAPIALVGKGVTFDTGGISLKPGAGMDEMKYDMGGAATVLGVFKSLGELKPNVNVVGVIPSTENMPSDTATKPGDVVTSLSGQTIEVLNTDAEGRLILCDALTYTQQTFKPSKVIDMATLTGACIIALGHHISAVLGNDQDLVDDLLQASNDTYDRFWQLPLSDEYDEQLKSNFADMANIGGRPAGTITAAQFLARYTQDIAWAHLDIAGTAWTSGANKGATGRPVPALIEYLVQQAN